MPTCTLQYDGKCELNIVVDIHGVEKDLSVIVDTGFVSATGFGLKLPSQFVTYAHFTGTGFVRVADGRQIAAASIPDAKIVQVGGTRLRRSITIPAVFMSDHGLIGVMFLQQCVSKFDGPQKTATIDHAP